MLVSSPAYLITSELGRLRARCTTESQPLGLMAMSSHEWPGDQLHQVSCNQRRETPKTETPYQHWVISTLRVRPFARTYDNLIDQRFSSTASDCLRNSYFNDETKDSRQPFESLTASMRMLLKIILENLSMDESCLGTYRSQVLSPGSRHD